jgi:hypothetical protein
MDSSTDPSEQNSAQEEGKKKPKDRFVHKLERKIQRQAEVLADLMTDADQMGYHADVHFYSSKVYELDVSEKKGTFSMQRTHKNRFYSTVTITEKKESEADLGEGWS